MPSFLVIGQLALFFGGLLLGAALVSAPPAECELDDDWVSVGDTRKKQN